MKDEVKREDMIARLTANTDQDREHLKKFIRESSVADLMPIMTAMNATTDDPIRGMVNALAMHAFAGLLADLAPEMTGQTTTEG